MIEFTDSGSKLNENDILHIENTIGATLPADYRAFLLKTNGGRPEPNAIDIDGAPFVATNVGVFHGMHMSIPTDDIFWNLDVLDGCKENKLLPIATDPFGHLFMLVLTDENYGHVNYFDSDEIPPRPYFVARDFNEFLSKIRAHTPEELADIHAAARGPDHP